MFVIISKSKIKEQKNGEDKFEILILTGKKVAVLIREKQGNYNYIN